MLVGHFAAALAAKRVAPKLPLGTAMFSSMLPDLLWCVFLFAGIERVQFQPGRGAAHYIGAAEIPFSHSLLMDAVWAALLAAAYFFFRRYPRGACVLFAAVLSHWLLDFVSNRDMPLAPGIRRPFGLQLWANVPATLLVEGCFWLVALILYARVASPRKRTGIYAFWIVAALLTERWYANITGTPPPNLQAAAIGGFIFFSLVVAWAYWIDRLRGPARYSINWPPFTSKVSPTT